MINIRVFLIIRVLIILKYFGDLDFECYIYITQVSIFFFFKLPLSLHTDTHIYI